MLERIPKPVELLVLLALALIGTVVVALFPKHDYGIMVATMPLFFTSSMLGFRAKQRRTGPKAPAKQTEEAAS
jgi:hypothetical protein